MIRFEPNYRIALGGIIKEHDRSGPTASQHLGYYRFRWIAELISAEGRHKFDALEVTINADVAHGNACLGPKVRCDPVLAPRKQNNDAVDVR